MTLNTKTPIKVISNEISENTTSLKGIILHLHHNALENSEWYVCITWCILRRFSQLHFRRKFLVRYSMFSMRPSLRKIKFSLVYTDVKFYLLKVTLLLFVLLLTFQYPKQGLPETRWPPRSRCTTPRSVQRRRWRHRAEWTQSPSAAHGIRTSPQPSRICQNCML